MMEVIIIGVEGIDIPITKDDEEYYELQNTMEDSIRERLQLKKTDEVTFRFQKA